MYVAKVLIWLLLAKLAWELGFAPYKLRGWRRPAGIVLCLLAASGWMRLLTGVFG